MASTPRKCWRVSIATAREATVIFWSRDLVDAHTAAWVEDCYGWLIETLGPKEFFEETRLIEPTKAFFDVPGGDSHETALAVFDSVKDHMGMAEWPCDLVRQDSAIDPTLAPTLAVADVAQPPAGTFFASEETIEISYDPQLMKQPLGFISMLAHELSHYLLAPYVEDAPGGEEAHEILTDLTAIYAGFGIFEVQGGMIAEGHQDAFSHGWRIGNLGYLSTEVRCYALAVFLELKGINPDIPEKYLDHGKTRLYRKALKLVAKRRDSVAALRELAGVRET